MNLGERCFELMNLLRTGHRWQRAELADRLGETEAAIGQLLDELVSAGAPVVGDGQCGWQLVGLIDLPPLALTFPELNALQLALLNLIEEGDDKLAVAAGYVLDKIEAGLPPYLQEFDPGLHCPETLADDELEAEVLAQRAIEQQRRLSFRYVDSQNSLTRRTVRPLHVEGSGLRSKLVAWCELREDFRVFKLERTEELEMGEAFVAEPGRTYADYLRLRG